MCPEPRIESYDAAFEALKKARKQQPSFTWQIISRREFVVDTVIYA